MNYSRILLIAMLVVGTNGLNAQLLKNAQDAVKKSTGASLTQEDAAAGMKEALTNGVSKGVETLSKQDGYFGDAAIKIPFPADAKVMEDKLRAIGMGGEVDKAVLSINRAAEAASLKAKDIFVASIKGMSVTDAVSVVKGSDNAATQYLKTNTSTQLTQQFSPIIKESLDNVGATKYWTDLVNTYNKIPMVKKMNPNLTDYTTKKAIDGLFVKIAQEESAIRKDPSAQTSALLKKVFGK